MATRTTTAQADCWVVCDGYAAGPYTPDAAPRVKAKHDAAPACAHSHEIVTSRTKPVTASELRAMRAEWDAPFLADPADEAACAERRALGEALAAATLAAKLMTRIGDLTVVEAGWSRETCDHADSIATPGSAEWIAALGAHEHATLTADGKPAIRDGWCRCSESLDTWVRYEGWTAEGRTAHGFVCGTCRKITQVG